MEVLAGNAQHIGARGSQQDAFGFSALSDTAFRAHAGVLMVLCDGMGGLANGEAAATAAVQAVLRDYARKQTSEPVPDALERAIKAAQQAVLCVAGDGPQAGSTIIAAVVRDDSLYWAALGDSRLYLCRGGQPAQQLTEDHNVATALASQVARGEISADAAAQAPDREALTSYLGSPYPPPANPAGGPSHTTGRPNSGLLRRHVPCAGAGETGRNRTGSSPYGGSRTAA